VRFHVLTAVSMNMTAFWDTASCCLEKADCFRGVYLHHHQDDDEVTHCPDNEGSKHP
jgi:hypothetical protein